MYKQRWGFFIFVYLVWHLNSYSQITASVSTINGCAPLAVTFAAPNGAIGTWNFGPPGTSTLSSGSFNYNNPGTYTVTYSGTNGGTPVNFTVTANVYAKPVANFTMSQPLSGCAIKTITLSDQSTGPSINSWIWTYGDGGSGTYTNSAPHTYSYTIPGTYSVSLQVTNIYNCSDQITIGTINVYATPTAVINSNPVNLSSCTPPFSAIFSASNSIGPNLTYAWDFGNSQTFSGVTSNQISYNTQGNYVVTLTVTSNGCSSVDNKLVVVNPTTLSATVPSTVCLGSPFTVTLSSNQPSTTWNFGGGIVTAVPSGPNSTTATIGVALTNSGVATITITSGFGACQSVLTKTIFVEQVIANFASSLPNFSCSSPFNVVLQNLSSINATQFTFSVPAFQQSTVTPPPPTNTLSYQFSGSVASFTIPYIQGSLNPYANFNSPYSLAYAPSVTMIAVSASGCSNTVVHTLDSITRPTASFYKNRKDGCVPLSITLSSNSYTFAHDPVTSYTWCNGATPPVFITGLGPAIPSQTFVYNAAGSYSPYLIIQTAAGCADISFTEQVTAATPPVISFTFTPNEVCHNEPVQIINTTAPSVSSTVNHWHVESDEGYFSGCINDPNPSWAFTHVGVHSLTMSAYVDGCRSSVTSVGQVTVNGPIVSGRYETNCSNRMDVNFYSTLQSAPSATLDFGDNSPTYTMTNGGGTVYDFITHTYTLSGDYTATLTGANPVTGCQISTYTMLVTVRNIQASFSGTPVACMNASVSFNASSSQDVLVGCSRGYVWYVDNQPPLENTSSTFTTAFGSAGIHTLTLMVKDINSCRDTAVRTIRISSVTPSFSFASPSVCVNSPIQLINNSTSVPLDPIVSQQWTFGDGQTSNAISPTHSYSFALYPSLTYNAFLTITNSMGCTGTTQRSIQVVKPNTYFSASQYSICVGPTDVNFNIQPTSGATYTMHFQGSAPSVSTAPLFSHTYTQAGTYTVGLSVKDGNGCLAEGLPISIFAQTTPTASFIFKSQGSTTDKNVICANAPVSFTSTSVPVNQTYTYNWNFGIGSPVISNSVVANTFSSNVTQTFTISLTVSTSNMCQSSVTRSFTIYNPKANINIDKSQICLRDAVRFNIKDTTGSGIKGWVWDYGDFTESGGTITAVPAPPSSTLHTYNIYPASGVASVSLIYYSSEFACVATATVLINIIKIDADFKRNDEVSKQDSVHCLRITDTFSNTSPNSGSSTFRWGFGNGDISLVQNPQYTYPLPGVYQVTLTVIDPTTCKGISTKNMTINPLPLASINSKDSICQGSSFDLVGSGTSTAGIIGYQWLPSSAVNSPGAGVTAAVCNSSIAPVYSLSVTDGNNCVSDPATHTVYIQPPAPQLQWDTTVIVGQQIPINAFVGSSFSYSWSPGADLNCISCANPLSTSTVNVTYSVQVEDNMKCFVVTNTYSIYIDPQTSVDVPTAFTPNGDGVNDVIFPDGWGIKKLNYFKVFNRWGQLLFETSEIKAGWDGTYNGVPQNMETYVYQVSVETYLDAKPLQKTSSFKLIR